MKTNPTAWPVIHLDAVNKQAAFLLHRTGADTAPVQQYIASIRADMEKVDRAISSISGQLKTRSDSDWAPSALRALKGYHAQQRTLKRMLHAASEALATVRARIKENEKTARMREHEAGAIAQREAKEKARLERIAASTSSESETFKHFKVLVRELIGPEKCAELLNRAREEAAK